MYPFPFHMPCIPFAGDNRFHKFLFKNLSLLPVSGSGQVEAEQQRVGRSLHEVSYLFLHSDLRRNQADHISQEFR